MKKILLVVSSIVGCMIFPIFVFASNQIIDCSFWVKGGSGTGSCSGSTITFDGSDNFWFDGTPTALPSSGYVMSSSTNYYVVINSPTGSGTGSVAIIDNLGNEINTAFTAGGGQQNISETTMSTGSTYQSGIKSDFSGGSRINGTVSYFCISDVSFADCTPAPAPPTPKLFYTDLGIFGNATIGNSTSTEGIYLGKDVSSFNQKMEIVGPATGMAYIDFTKPLNDFLGRISFDNLLGNMTLFASNNILFNPTNWSIFTGKVGIGTSTPFATLSINSTASTPFFIGSSTPLFSIDKNGHIGTSGYSSVLSACGTSPGVVGDDTAGTITVGTNATGCTLNFATDRVSVPHCVVSNQTPINNKVMSYTVSSSQLVITQQTLGGSKIDYICLGQ